MPPPNIMGDQAVAKYSLQGTAAAPVFGTATAPATTCGIVRWNRTKQNNPREFRGAGSRNLIKVRGGMAMVPFDIEQDVQTVALAQLGVRHVTAGLPFFTLGLGWDFGATQDADQIRDCKVHTLSLNLEAGEGGGTLSSRITGVGGVVSNLTTLTMAQLTPNVLAYYDCICEVDADGPGAGAYVGHQIRSFGLEVNHNVKVGAYIRGVQRTAGEERFFDYQDDGVEDIRFTLVRHERSTWNFLTNEDGVPNLRLSLVDISDATHTLTITLTGCWFDEEQAAATDPDGYLLFTVPGRAKTWSLAGAP